jgi:hypothetical protein
LSHVILSIFMVLGTPTLMKNGPLLRRLARAATVLALNFYLFGLVDSWTHR